MSVESFHTLQVCLATMAGEVNHEFDMQAIQLVSSSAALLDSDKKARLRLLEAVGDNAISMAVATRCLEKQRTAQVYQDARSVVTSNAKLAELFVNGGFAKFVTFVAGVSAGSKAGASALEAFVGVIYSELGMNGVISFCDSSGLFDAYTGW